MIKEGYNLVFRPHLYAYNVSKRFYYGKSLESSIELTSYVAYKHSQSNPLAYRKARATLINIYSFWVGYFSSLISVLFVKYFLAPSIPLLSFSYGLAAVSFFFIVYLSCSTFLDSRVIRECGEVERIIKNKRTRYV